MSFLALLTFASWGALRKQGPPTPRRRSLPPTISQGTAEEDSSLPGVAIASPTVATTDGGVLPPVPREACEWEETLGVSTGIAERIQGILLRRDEEAEGILASHLDDLTRERLTNLYPQLHSVEWQADREIEALLTVSQADEYRRLRAEGMIAGVAIAPPPQSPVPSP